MEIFLVLPDLFPHIRVVQNPFDQPFPTALFVRGGVAVPTLLPAMTSRPPGALFGSFPYISG